MKVFVTGVGGQLGHDVMNELHKRGYEGIGSDLAPAYSGIQDGSAVTAMPYVSLDITNVETVREKILKIAPDVVIHCAGWTAVDAAEDEDKQALVRKINVDGTRHIAEVCKDLDCKMLYLSTDYVFNGWIRGLYNDKRIQNYLLNTDYVSKQYVVSRLNNELDTILRKH